MKIHELLCESTDDNIVNRIVLEVTNNCQPFLKQIKYQVSDECLYRGIGMAMITPPSEVNPLRSFPGHNPNRRPTDTPTYVHNELNHIFQHQFHYPFRNGTFVSGDEHIASNYGNTGIVLPVGEFHFLWSKYVHDLFNQWDSFEANMLTTAKNKNESRPKREDIYDQFLSLVEDNQLQYQINDLQAAITSGHEIMLYCDRYYLLSVKDYNVVKALKIIQKNHGV